MGESRRPDLEPVGGLAVQAGVAGFYVVASLLALAAGWSAHLSWGFYALTLLYAARLLDQARRVRLDRPMLALRLFKSNAWAGLILFAAIVAGSFGSALL